MLLKNLVSYFRTHTFSNIILSFVAILTLALTLLGIFSYNAYRGALMENAVNGSRTKMELIQEQIDAEVQSLHYAMLSILSNSTLSNFENYTKSASADSQFKLKNMMQQIVYLENSYPQLDSIWLYSSRDGLFITKYGCFTEEEFFQERYALTTSAGRSLQEALDEQQPFSYLATMQVKSYYSNTECISFIRSVSGYSGQPDGQIILNVKSGTLTNILKKVSAGEDLTAVLLDQEGAAIASSREGFPTGEYAPQVYRILTEGGGAPQEFSLGGQQYLGWLTVSSSSGMQYVSLINKDVLLQNVDSIRYVTVLLCLVCLAVSAVLAFSLTNRLFAPIQKIMRYVQAELGQPGLENYRDVLLIQRFIDYMKSQNSQLQEHIDSYTSVMQEAILTECIYSQEQQPVLELYRQTDFKVDFPYENFTAAVVPFRQPGRPDPLDSDTLIPEVSGITAEDQFSGKTAVWFLRQSEYLILILNTQEGEPLVQDFFARLKLRHGGEGLLYAYGKTYGAVSGLYDSFHQAVNILMVKPDPARQKKGYESAINAQYITSRYPQEAELKLISLVKSRAPEDAVRQLLEEIIQENKEDGGHALRLESLFVQLLMTLNHIAAELNLSAGAVFGKGCNLYRQLEQLPGVEEKEHYILQAFGKLTEYIRLHKPSKTMELYQLMLGYVAEHYQEDLSLNDISYQLQLSPSYLSSVFKEYHHSTFLEYVNQYRVAKAKPLLLNSQEPVSAIAQRVGCANVNTFIRIFKKEEGVTPGQFRSRS